MKSVDIAKALLKLAKELDPKARVIIGIVPPAEENDELAIDTMNASHQDIAAVAAELTCSLADLISLMGELPQDAAAKDLPS